MSRILGSSAKNGTKQIHATETRKSEHLALNVAGPVRGSLSAGFERYRFEPCALPELDLDDVSLETDFLGRRLAAPLLISCMTGGTPDAAAINEVLAETAQARGLALGLGSGRVALENPSAPGFDVRRLAPGVPLLCNLGAAQLNRGTGVDDCRRLLDQTRADALVLHLNAVQEALQPEGEPRFRGLLARIGDLCSNLGAPVIVKEVGFGISAGVAAELYAAGVAAVDVAGAGGTSWSEVERHRLTGLRAAVAAEFAGWGIPTAEAIPAVRAVAGTRPVIASGGITSGMEAAIALALGADLAGLAGPFLRAAATGREQALELADQLTGVLRIVLFGVGARDIAGLHAQPRLAVRGPSPG